MISKILISSKKFTNNTDHRSFPTYYLPACPFVLLASSVYMRTAKKAAKVFFIFFHVLPDTSIALQLSFYEALDR